MCSFSSRRLDSTPSRIAMLGTTMTNLREAVLLVQLGNRAQVDVGLAGAGLHLDAEVEPARLRCQVSPKIRAIAGTSDPSSWRTGRSWTRRRLASSVES